MMAKAPNSVKVHPIPPFLAELPQNNFSFKKKKSGLKAGQTQSTVHNSERGMAGLLTART